MKRHNSKWFALGSMAALLLATGGVIPAQAHQDYNHDYHYHRHSRMIQRDMDAISRDQQRLSDLRSKAADQRASGDWHGLHWTQSQISRARLDLQRDRDRLRADQS